MHCTGAERYHHPTAVGEAGGRLHAPRAVFRVHMWKKPDVRPGFFQARLADAEKAVEGLCGAQPEWSSLNKSSFSGTAVSPLAPLLFCPRKPPRPQSCAHWLPFCTHWLPLQEALPAAIGVLLLWIGTSWLLVHAVASFAGANHELRDWRRGKSISRSSTPSLVVRALFWGRGRRAKGAHDCCRSMQHVGLLRSVGRGLVHIVCGGGASNSAAKERRAGARLGRGGNAAYQPMLACSRQPMCNACLRMQRRFSATPVAITITAFASAGRLQHPAPLGGMPARPTCSEPCALRRQQQPLPASLQCEQ